MVKRRFNKVQILRVLQKYEDGMPINRIIEEYGISQATFYNWKAKYSRSSFNYIQELNKLREDNERLKRMFADLSLENLSLKSQLKKHTDV
jgi:putative transposase